jgi:RNA polymerase sigma factor (sigma-70 family)
LQRSVHELTSAIASGSADAFTEFFQTHFEAMYADARRMTRRDEAFCLDVVQDAMIRVIKSMKSMDSQDHLRRWLRIVVGACAYDCLRQEVRRRRREAQPRPGSDGTTREIQDQLEWLWDQFTRLDEGSTHLLVLRYRLGWTLQEIGAVLGLTTGAVDGRLSRILISLRRKAREVFDER